ncbi:alpha-amylase family glycosyl hydrolase [Nocardiopsis sp. RSe5-2]|uniref:Alpha-amylase family glycosyl hydrolase n=1 Tax=Nocardiopsis endophytica TaxID=3018445 RepID=A0ABT4UEK0_9ACTN|nr:alpha-amylase family glycosyl hydrolase [Nocardiopsis endophytica]MDA2815181.1 alpha-amylase family glycosyl hydrolase [Nocardiopsis endophytica]
MSTHTAPSSTYRLQMRPAGGLRDAAETAPYLHRLGVGALYTAPLLAAPGSTHGYDWTDPRRVCPDLGGEEARAALAARLRALGLGLVVDIVPNHMSVAVPEANAWWWEVLRDGPGAAHARCFDIDWRRGPLELPVLPDDGDGGAAALGRLELRDGALELDGRRYPVAPGTAPEGDRSDPARVHGAQHYRLVSWRRSREAMSYRRFFDVSDLAALRVEDPWVFERVHREVLRWAEEGEVTGLRVDHPDGLADPGGYLRRLRGRFDGWIAVEKILAPGEDPPQTWPVEGTTGYDALREVCGVFIDPAGEAPLTRLAEELGAPGEPGPVEEECKRRAAMEVLAAETRRIAEVVDRVGRRDGEGGSDGEDGRGDADGRGAPDRRDAPDGPSPATVRAVAELLAAFPAYRTYLPEGEGRWAQAVRRARKRAGEPTGEGAGEGAWGGTPDAAAEVDRIDAAVRADPGGEAAVRIQQTSGMVMAKGVEDTAFYRATRFIALNEVGGDPSEFGVSVDAFHAAQARREASHPRAMTTLSTHDTKRSEDVRARLAVIAEVPDAFADLVREGTGRCGLSEPSLNLLAWQTLVGAWPISAARLRDHLLKAAREAKLATSWTDPDPAFEEEVRAWPERVMSDGRIACSVEGFVARIRAHGWSNALGQKLVQLLMPGVPDVYQGTELWDMSLVDPDNRRPVDFTAREVVLERLESGRRPPVDASGEAKMHVVRQALRLRRRRDLRGYLPLRAEGGAAGHAVAFARGPGGAVAAVATRLPVGLEAEGGWGDTVLPLPSGPGRWRDLLSGREVETPGGCRSAAPRLGDLLAQYPVALLERRE